jgi:hypothetical protein
VWKEEASLIPTFYERFEGRMPKALWDEHEALLARLEAWPHETYAGAPKRAAAQ